jgi:hypothetical protein
MDWVYVRLCLFHLLLRSGKDKHEPLRFRLSALAEWLRGSGGGVGRKGSVRELWNNNSAERAIVPPAQLAP